MTMQTEMSEQEAAEKMHMVDAAMDATRRLSSAAFLVMYRLIDHGDYEAAPPPDEIAEEVHMSPRKVKRVMRELIDAGLIDERKLDDAGWINIDVGDFHHQEWIAGPNRNIWFEDREQFEEYSRDPEAWSAKYVGLSVEDYREWIRLKGRALCGATTKGGKPCQSVVAWPLDGEAAEWKALHRKVACKAHGGECHGRRRQNSFHCRLPGE